MHFPETVHSYTKLTFSTPLVAVAEPAPIKLSKAAKEPELERNDLSVERSCSALPSSVVIVESCWDLM